MILAMEIADKKGWKYLRIESDSKSALLAFENPNIVPWTLRNRLANCLQLGLCAGDIFLDRAMLVLAEVPTYLRSLLSP
jgi:hypothetical protein